MAANIDQLSGGRFTLNVVSAWWAEEAKQYNGIFTAHDERYARTEEFVTVMKGLWADASPYSFSGHHYTIEQAELHPKPVQRPGIKLYAGGESEAGKRTIVEHCDAYVMHGGTVEEVAHKIDDMKVRRERRDKRRSRASVLRPTSFVGIRKKKHFLNGNASRTLRKTAPVMPVIRISSVNRNWSNRSNETIIPSRTVVYVRI